MIQKSRTHDLHQATPHLGRAPPKLGAYSCRETRKQKKGRCPKVRGEGQAGRKEKEMGSDRPHKAACNTNSGGTYRNSGIILKSSGTR